MRAHNKFLDKCHESIKSKYYNLDLIMTFNIIMSVSTQKCHKAPKNSLLKGSLTQEENC